MTDIDQLVARAESAFAGVYRGEVLPIDTGIFAQGVLDLASHLEHQLNSCEEHSMELAAYKEAWREVTNEARARELTDVSYGVCPSLRWIEQIEAKHGIGL